MAGIPAIFPLCAIGRQFSNAVLQYDSISTSTARAFESDARDFEGATDDGGRSFQSETDCDAGGAGAWAGAAGRRVKKGLMDVRRLTEEQGDGNQAIRGGPADW